MAALSDTFENKLIDFLLRGQALGLTNSTAAAGSGPTNTYVGLLTGTVTNNDTLAGLTEVSTAGTGYARVTVASSLANWAGTQGAGTTTASTGTTGTTSNNTAITYSPNPSASWGTVTYVAVYDAATAGNILFATALTTPKTINTGDTVSFAAGQLTFQLDN